ncbi:MAG: nucleotidyltransferase family protein [Candidatus Obscuribacter phosphatis]|uniref:Nucleotidyltransferase family protein n=1 Tax=Candidatus Obscuribacter phosphatis TaxID=1906157 RepID=A0A8J7TN11_9BACT|nr:nucleotidyltransferase family protein [Candidatus Obscuribacter phosphatis]
MKHAVILAGSGDKVRPVQDDKPTSMISVMGRPLLACLIQWLSANGIRNITITCSHRYEMIREYFGDGQAMGVNINYLLEDEPLGSGGAVKNALRFLAPASDEPVLVVNADSITNLNLGDVFAYHDLRKAKVTMVSVPMVSPYGVVDFNEKGQVTAFREKPELPYWVNAGIYVIDPSIYELLPDRGSQEQVTFPLLAEKGQLHAFKSQAFWRSINNVRDISELRADMEKLFLSLFFSPVVSYAANNALRQSNQGLSYVKAAEPSSAEVIEAEEASFVSVNRISIV